MKRYWIASVIVVLAFTVGLSFVTDWYWLIGLVLAALYGLIGTLVHVIEDENSALQTENRVVE